MTGVDLADVRQKLAYVEEWNDDDLAEFLPLVDAMVAELEAVRAANTWTRITGPESLPAGRCRVLVYSPHEGEGWGIVILTWLGRDWGGFFDRARRYEPDGVWFTHWRLLPPEPEE